MLGQSTVPAIFSVNTSASYSSSDYNGFRVNPGAAAIDRGVVLPNVNDGFAGKAPDLGALEAGQPLPKCGPRR